MYTNISYKIQVGVERVISDENTKFRRVLKYCPKPCGGRQPCIRTCLCGRGMMSNEQGKCEPMSEMVKLQLKEHDHGEILTTPFI